MQFTESEQSSAVLVKFLVRDNEWRTESVQFCRTTDYVPQTTYLEVLQQLEEKLENLMPIDLTRRMWFQKDGGTSPKQPPSTNPRRSKNVL